jgi:LuxR family maltose regulon positive regulatory protein
MAEGKGPVLIVDDEPDIVDFLTTMILDLMMPQMNGFEVLDALRNGSSPTLRPSVIVLSAKSTHQDILDALEKGADDFIAKPFDLEDLLLRIRVWMDRARPSEPPTDTLRIYTLGPFRVLRGEELLFDEETGDPRAKLLLKYLVSEWDQPIKESQVLYLLWPDMEEQEATQHLDELLTTLQTMTGAVLPNHSYISHNGSELQLNVDADLWVDAHEFESQAQTAQDAQEAGDTDVALGLFLSALALYKEDYLRENLYEDWPSDRREKLRELWISSMFRVAAICADRCEYADGVRLMKKVLDIDPYRENAYQALMLYLSRAGRRSEAIQLYRYAERLFAQHLAAQPAPSTRMLYEKILRGETS